jgi:hypothetical protein
LDISRDKCLEVASGVSVDHVLAGERQNKPADGISNFDSS